MSFKLKMFYKPIMENSDLTVNRSSPDPTVNRLSVDFIQKRKYILHTAILIVLLLFSNNVVSFLWLNLIGAILTVIFALFLQIMLSLDNKKVNT